MPSRRPGRDKQDDSPQDPDDLRPAAIVIGAGVAGLTAAHELAKRNFRVSVIEREIDSRGAGRQPAIGGMARSQFMWGSADNLSSGKQGVAVWQDDKRSYFREPRFAVTVARFKIVTDPDPAVDLVSDGAELEKAVTLLRDGWDRRLEASSRPLRIRIRATRARALRLQRMDLVDLALKLIASCAEKFPNPTGTARTILELLQSPHQRWELLVVPATEMMCSDAADEAETDGDVVLLLPEAPKLVGDAGLDLPPAGTPDPSGKTAADPPGGASDWRRERVLEFAGEHGFRFFPSFYAHVFDTMRRTPILDDDEDDWCEGAADRATRLDGDRVYRTVFDNLVSQDQFVLGLPDEDGVSVVDRATAGSLDGAFRMLRTFQRRLGFETRDLVRLQLRMLAYLTSCRERRDRLESVSWSEYLRLDDGFSSKFREAMRSWPQVLVGMKADETDARTYAGVTVQMVTDALDPSRMRDATLNGPTTTAWFDPWKRYLRRAHGVRFYRDEALTLYLHPTGKNRSEVRAEFRHGLAYDDAPPGSQRVGAAKAAATGQEAGPERDDPRRAEGEEVVLRHLLPAGAYLVLAVSPHEAHRLTTTLELDAREKHPARVADVSDAPWVKATKNVLGRDFHPDMLRDADLSRHGLPLRHFVGLQYFVRDGDVPYFRGHLFLPEHELAISGISQSQFRVARASLRVTRGTLSFDLGNADAVWTRTRWELARDVWDHLVACLGPRAATVPPLGDVGWIYHVDDGLVYDDWKRDPESRPHWAPVWWQDVRDDRGGPIPDAVYRTPWRLETNWRRGSGVHPCTRPVFNNTPYLIVPPGRMKTWPGRVDADRPDLGYAVELGNLVCCGTHVRTFTRMATMESANESARHAVNGILRHWLAENRGIRVDVEPRPDPGHGPRTSRDGAIAVDTGNCRVFPLDEREPPSLDVAKRLDAAMLEAGLPHLFDVLRLDEIVRDSMPGDDDGPTSLFDDLLATLTSTGDLSRLGRWASPFLLRMLSTFLKVSRGAS